MVMEEMPSPQCVGREFVRQYYTLLNQAPMHLHRFYNENSSFVHGGLDTPNRETKPVIGQRQIHHRIQQLEFNDCHAKIRQVDSQATLGNGVVVQVTGELSNNGEPMRRFTQTFVLAQQSPKKYYVHNDIFRYQDEMINEEECEPDSGRSEAEEDLEDGSQPEPTATVTVTAQVPTAAMNLTTYYNVPQQPQPQATVQPTPAVTSTATTAPTLNGSTVAEVSIVSATQAPATVLASTPAVTTTISTSSTPAATVQPTTTPPVVEAEEAQDADDEADDSIKTSTEASQAPQVLEVPEPAVSVSQEPKTYATLVKSGGAGMSFANIIANNSSPLRPPSPTTTPLDSTLNATSAAGAGTATSPTQQPLPPRSNTQQRSSGNAGSRAGAGARSSHLRASDERREGGGRESGSEDRRRMSGGPAGAGSSMYPDNQQVFVGNVPITANETDLREIFSKYGTIVDVRLNCKPSNKCPPGKIFPKYGFIVFGDSSSVQQCLTARPISMGGEPPNNLNVEEKRNKFRSEGRMSMNEERGRASMGRSGGGGGGGGSSGNMMRSRNNNNNNSNNNNEGGNNVPRGGRITMRGGSEGGRGGMLPRGTGGGNSYNNRR